MKKLLSSVVALAMLSSAAIAQTPPTNPHTAHDQKMRACRAEAKQQGLVGTEADAYIAQCMKR